MKESIPIVLILMLLSSTLAFAGKTLTHLRTCYMENPLGLEERPDFNWQMQDDKNNYQARQTAYRIVVADSKENLEKGRTNLYGQLPQRTLDRPLYL